MKHLIHRANGFFFILCAYMEKAGVFQSCDSAVTVGILYVGMLLLLF